MQINILGFMIDATVQRFRTIRFHYTNNSETPNDESGWRDGGDRVTLIFFCGGRPRSYTLDRWTNRNQQ